MNNTPMAGSCVEQTESIVTTTPEKQAAILQLHPSSSPLSSPPSLPNPAVQDALGRLPKRCRLETEDATAPQPKRSKTTPCVVQRDGLTLDCAPEQAKNAQKLTVDHPPPSSNRPSRNRKPPNEYWIVAEGDQKPTTKTGVAKKGVGRVFDPVFITSNSASRLGKADVYHMLLESSAWTSLSEEQQSTLVSMLPPGSMEQHDPDRNEAGDAQGKRPQAFTMSNDCFRTDVAKFKEDLKNGHLGKTWQAAAEHATTERAAGDYGKWKADEAELWWGQRSKKSDR